VHWFTEVTRDEASDARSHVNAWYEEFPDPDGTFAARLRSEIDADHYQSLDELFVHHLLVVDWGDVRYEEFGAGPDFRIYDPDGEYLAGIEVASLFQQEDWSADERRHGRLIDAVNAAVAPTQGYMIGIQIETPDVEPIPRRFIAWLRRTLDSLPEITQATAESLPERVFEDNGMVITVTFFRLKPDADARADPDAQIVGMGPAIGGMVNTSGRIRDRVDAKAGGRYETDDAPFLIAIGMHDTFQTDYAIETALYGTEAVEVPSGVLTRNNDGTFGIDPGSPTGRHRRLSAVAFIREIRFWQPADIDIAVAMNPFATHPWPPQVLPVDRWYREVGRTESNVQFGWTESGPGG